MSFDEFPSMGSRKFDAGSPTKRTSADFGEFLESLEADRAGLLRPDDFRRACEISDPLS